MQTKASNHPALRVRNFVVSGTNYWNPGDDFVRDGVIHILHALFPGEQLNLHFYNFNEDQFPKSKFKGIGNEVSAGDLELCRDFIDGVIVAGLSAGHEIKDLYRWVIANGLEDRVYLIGAGYENPYCAENMVHEPEATIFRKARIITGRTAKHPAFMDQTGTPYVHLNCPALLSVKQVKAVPAGKKIERIGFSIQLPHESGITNQSTGAAVSKLAIEVLFALARTHAVELVAHHKTEYFYFLHLLKDTGIPVIYSSFYQDLHEVYPRYDLVVTTRLHSSLFANGHGIPGIIINDTDRHTHTLEGFSHSVWVNTRQAFDREFARACRLDLSAVAAEMARFKGALTARYVETLKPVFAGLEVLVAGHVSGDDLAARLRGALGYVSVKQRVLDVMSGLTADYWLENNKEDYRKAIAAGAGWFDTPTFLNWFASELKPANYLEIGVRRGRSMSQVLTCSPETNAYGFDMWIQDYGCLPEKGIVTSNPGPQFVADELRRLGVSKVPTFIVGSSHETLRPFFADMRNPQQFDLMLVDGDHSDDGARKDLEVAFAHVAPGGAIVFDDTRNTAHPGLQGVWDSFKADHPDFLFIEDTHRTGTAIALRPPFDRLAGALAGRSLVPKLGETAATYQFDSEKKEQALVRKLVKPGMVVFDVGAHIGKYTKLFSLLVGNSGKVVSFEATPATGAKLADRIARESLSNVTLNRVAVSDMDGTVTIHQFPEEYSSWNGIGRPSMEDPRDPSKIVPFMGASEVPSISLDSYCRRNGIDRIDYLKLDVEGAEIFALRGAEDLFTRQAVGCIQFEISRKMLEGLGTRARQAFEFLSRHGYECHVIGEKGEIGPVATDSDSFYDNYVAFPVKVAQPAASEAPILSVHFFTIVLNGQPFIRHHIEQFKNLPFQWHWHIVEGVAELNHDTAWSRQHGGRIPADQHRNGLSIDGTTEYLDELKKQFPENITLHRPPSGRFWDGKREMVNAPLDAVPNDSLLWQVDVDELWTTTQIIRARALFLAHPEKTAAYFWCHYFVGPDRVITSRDTYGNHSDFEWLRVWRFRSGDRWMAHEPPRLGRCVNGAPPVDVASFNPFLHVETEAMGLVFQHYAYATEAQARFKRDYYGYPNAVNAWRSLQQAALPCRLGEHFDWVKDEATVDSSACLGLRLLAPGDWFGRELPATASVRGDVKRILFVRTDSIGDNVLASSMLEPIWKAHPGVKLAVLCQKHIAELYLASPFVETVICYEQSDVQTEAGQCEIIGEIAAFQPEVILNSVKSRDPLSETLTLTFRDARHIGIESDLCNISPEHKEHADRHYTGIIPSPGKHKPELVRHCEFLKGLGIDALGLQPVVWTSSADESVADEFFGKNQLDPAKTIALFPGAQHQCRVYGGYAGALKELVGFDFVVFGAEADSPLASDLAGKIPGKVINLCGMSSLRETAALLRRCRLYIGAESAGAHMACAVGIPNVVLLGGGHFGRFMPYSPLTAAVSLPMDCFGCNWACIHKQEHCVKDVPAALLAEAIRVTLAGLSSIPRIFVPAETVQGTDGEARIRQMETMLGGTDVELCPVPTAPLAFREAAAQPKVETGPAGIEAHLGQLEKALETGDRVGAEKILLKAHAAFPRDPELATALANLQFQLGHFQDAIPTFKTVCELKPQDPVLPVLLAHACMNVEDAEGVEAALALAFKVDAGNPHALRFLAEMNVKMGRHREAAKSYGQLVQGGCAEPDVLLALGGCFVEIGDRDGAWVCFKEVLRQQPENPEAIRRLNELQGRSGFQPDPLRVEVSETVHSSQSSHQGPDGQAGSDVLPTTPPGGEPVVSVIVSTYNSAKFMAACMEDMVAQTILDKLEILVIDSGSEENEGEIVAPYVRKHPNIRYIRTAREPLYVAWNRATKLARGKYVVNANTDDSRRPDAFEVLLQAMEAHPDADLAYAHYGMTSRPNDPFPPTGVFRDVHHDPYHPAQLLFYCVTGCLQFWRKTSLEKMGGWDESLKCVADYEILIRAMRQGLKPIMVPEKLSCFYINLQGLSFGSNKAAQEDEAIKARYRTEVDAAEIYAVDRNDPREMAKAWVNLGNFAAAVPVPWTDQAHTFYEYSIQCYQQAMRCDEKCDAVWHNLAVIAQKLGITDHLTKTFRATKRDLPTILARAKAKPKLIGFDLKPRVDGHVYRRAIQPSASAAGSGRKAGASPAALDVTWCGSFLDHGSLSHVNRALSDGLEKHAAVKLRRVQSGGDAGSVPPDLLPYVGKTSAKESGRPQVTVRHQWPPDWSRPKDGALVVIQPWEFGSLPKDWVKAAGNVDEFWVPSNYARKVYVASGIPTEKVVVVPNGVDLGAYRPGVQPLSIPTKKRFKFLFVGGTIGRKGPDVLLNAYLNAFTADDDVCLVIKDFGGNSFYKGQTFGDQIAQARQQPNAPEILHLTDDLPPEAMPRLYAACDCLVHPYRGEGFGMPVLEAMACGKPVLVTKGGATDDFVSEHCGWFIAAQKRSIGPKVGDIALVGDGWLLEPDVSDLFKKMRHVVANPDEALLRGRRGAEIARSAHGWEQIVAMAENRLQRVARSASGASAQARPATAPKQFELPKAALVGHIGDARELLHQKKHRAAWDSTCAAIAVRPFHPEGWLLLGQIAADAGDTKLAARCVDQVKALAPQWKPGKELAKALQKRASKKTLDWPVPAVSAKPRLTVCLIAKNEERFLGQCLASVKDVADEIVVVDTGSTDKTVEIAKSFGAKLGHFEWCNDFGAARNAALELATGDWILVLDADEELMPEHRAALAQEMADATTMAWRIPLVNVGKESDGVSYVPRLFRNAPALFYVGRVHEQVFTSIEVRRAEWGLDNKLGTTRLLHHGYTDELTRDRNKVERNLKLLEQAIEEIPGDVNLTFNLGLEMVRSGRLDAGLARYREAAELLGAQSSAEIVPELREVILTQWMSILKDAGRFDEVLSIRRQPLYAKGTITPSIHYMGGFAALRSGDAALAVEELRQAIAKRSQPGLTPIHRELHTCAPEHCLALAHALLKQPTEARSAFAAALQRTPNAKPVVLDLARFEAGEGDYGRALTLIHELVLRSPEDVGAWRLGAGIALNRPEVLEVALDWTQSALAQHPDDAELKMRRAEALLLGDRPAEALPFFQSLGATASASSLAARTLCELATAAGAVAGSTGGSDLSQAFLQWYRRLVDWNAAETVQRLNGRLEDVARVFPAAGKVLRTVLADVAS